MDDLFSMGASRLRRRGTRRGKGGAGHVASESRQTGLVRDESEIIDKPHALGV